MMIQEKDIPQIAAPTRKAIAKATVIAAVVAVILLFAAVLPAEYGFDPLRTGAALGLTGGVLMEGFGQTDVRVSRRARPKTEPRLLRQLRTRRQNRQN